VDAAPDAGPTALFTSRGGANPSNATPHGRVVNAHDRPTATSYRARMKHVSYADKSLFMGDEAADTLLEYARLVADSQRADTVTLRSISPDGNTVEASFLLDASTILMVESTNSEVEPPDNSEVVKEMQERIDAITRPVSVETEEPPYVDYDLPGTF
jgi:hypothetical protein